MIKINLYNILSLLNTKHVMNSTFYEFIKIDICNPIKKYGMYRTLDKRKNNTP